MGKGPEKFAIALRPRASGLLRPRAAALGGEPPVDRFQN
jgi:hypothetical protein